MSTPPAEKRLEIGDITMGWGSPARLKAELREESARRYQALPLAERLLIALSMIERKRKDERPSRP